MGGERLRGPGVQPGQGPPNQWALGARGSGAGPLPGCTLCPTAQDLQGDQLQRLGHVRTHLQASLRWHSGHACLLAPRGPPLPPLPHSLPPPGQSLRPRSPIPGLVPFLLQDGAPGPDPTQGLPSSRTVPWPPTWWFRPEPGVLCCLPLLSRHSMCSRTGRHGSQSSPPLPRQPWRLLAGPPPMGPSQTAALTTAQDPNPWKSLANEHMGEQQAGGPLLGLHPQAFPPPGMTSLCLLPRLLWLHLAQSLNKWALCEDTHSW